MGFIYGIILPLKHKGKHSDLKAATTAVVIFALGASAAFGFDSRAWQTRLVAFDREAERMRAACSNCAARVAAPAFDMTVPIDMYPSGAVKVSLRAARAQPFVDEGLIWAEGVVATMFDANGAEEGRAEVESGVFDWKSRSGWGEGRAKVVYRGSRMEGVGIFFSVEESFAKIHSAVKIEFEGVDVKSSVAGNGKGADKKKKGAGK